MHPYIKKRDFVLYTGGFLLPDRNAAAHRVTSVAKIIESEGSEVYLLERMSSASVSLANARKLDGSQAKNSRRWKSILRYIFGLNVIQVLKKNSGFNKLVLYNYHLFPSLIIWIYSRLNGIKVIGDITEWYNAENYPWILKPFAKLEITLRMRLMNKLYDGLIVISDYLYSYYNQKKRSNVIKIPPLIDIHDSKWRAVEKGIENYNLSDDKSIRIVYAGSLGSNKDDLAQVVRFIDDCRLATSKDITLSVAGVELEEYNRAFKKDWAYKLVREASWIEWLGKLTHSQVLELYARSDVLILFRELTRSNFAGYSTKLVEAVTAGLMIASNSEAIDEHDVYKAQSFIMVIDSKEIFSNDISISKSEIFSFIEKATNAKLHRKTINPYYDYNKFRDLWKCFNAKLN